MLCKKNCSHLLYNGVLLQIIILIGMMFPSVFGDSNTTVTCACQRSILNLFRQLKQPVFPENICRDTTADTAECEKGWCFKADIDIEKPVNIRGKYKEKGCSRVRTPDQPECDSIPLDEQGVKAEIRVCYCHEKMCNFEKENTTPKTTTAATGKTPASSSTSLLSSYCVLFLGLLLLFLHVN